MNLPNSFENQIQRNFLQNNYYNNFLNTATEGVLGRETFFPIQNSWQLNNNLCLRNQGLAYLNQLLMLKGLKAMDQEI